jgi:hypothetical protein
MVGAGRRLCRGGARCWRLAASVLGLPADRAVRCGPDLCPDGISGGSAERRGLTGISSQSRQQAGPDNDCVCRWAIVGWFQPARRRRGYHACPPENRPNWTSSSVAGGAHPMPGVDGRARVDAPGLSVSAFFHRPAPTDNPPAADPHQAPGPHATSHGGTRASVRRHDQARYDYRDGRRRIRLW